jgi:DNA repair protein RadC
MPQTRADPGGPAGHRTRLRQRALAAGLSALPDYELLELYLFRTLPRGDVKPLAKALMVRFGGLAEVIGAPEAELAQCAGIGVATASDLKIAQELAVRATRAEARRRPVISSWSALIAYVRVSLAQERREQVRVIFLDRKNQLQSDEMLGQGTVDHAPVYPREIMRRALELSSSSLILVHNHPSCDPTPSAADIAMTREIVEAGRLLKITVHDHIVVGRDGVASLKALGLV